jgi:tetratricopeptide (TPR) repeat protein
VRVASRTSAFWFKGKDVDIPTVAQKLNVATVLEGSVRKSGKRVRVTAQLIEVASDSHLWSETYDRELDDIFAVQDDIAQSVVGELRARLLGSGASAAASVKSEVQAATAGRADNAEAHRLYLQGRYYLERMTGADVARAVELFRQAIALDENFAVGWTGLSRAYGIQAGYGWAPVAEGYERARDAAMHALALNESLAEAHVCLGQVLDNHDWNWLGAEAEYRRALALAPENVEVLRAAAYIARRFGDHDGSISLLRKAAALDPLSSAVQRALGLRYFFAERFDEAMIAFEATLDLNPKAGLVHAFMAVTRAVQGRGEEALLLADREVLPDFRLLAIAMATHALGHAGERDTALAQLIADFGDKSAFQIAELCAWFGDADRAFEWLERGYTARDPGMNNTLHDPMLRSLHRDPRWQPFLDKMGFPRQVSGKSAP